MKIRWLLAGIGFASLAPTGVGAKGIDTTGFYELSLSEKRLSVLAPLVTSGETDSIRAAVSMQLFRSLDSVLQTPGSFHYPFDSLKARTISIVISPDKKFRLLTFNQISLNGDHRNFGFLQMAGSENLIYALADTAKKPAKDFLNAELDAQEWYGALYYSIVPFRYHRKKMYLLLGYDGATIHSNKKVLDILWFDKGTPVFGKELFKEGGYDRKPACRVVYEFHNSSLMLMHYEEKENIVVLDKLAPAFPEAVNDFYYYIPSGDYDYYSFRKGYWTKDALDNFNLGQGKKPKTPKALPKPEDDPQNQ
jgi:hypothetical protein